MGLTARKPEGSDLELIPEETYQAICYAVVDLGTQHVKYAETEGKDVERVIIAWEIPDQRILIEKDGKKLDLPRAISKEYTLSLHKKSNLRPMLESWRGKAFTPQEEEGFHLKNLLGINCMLQILHGTSKSKGEPYHYVSNVSKLYHGLTKKEAENKFQYFNFDEHREIPDNIPEWMQKKIMDSYEWQENIDGENQAMEHAMAEEPHHDDDIPF